MGRAKFTDEDTHRLIVIPSWLERSYTAWRKDLDVCAYGLDVARSRFGDQTVLTAAGEGGAKWQEQFQSIDTMQVIGWVIRQIHLRDKYDIRELRDRPVVVDVVGIGSGVFDRMREQGIMVIDFAGGGSSEFKDYVNLRAESYGEFGKRLDPKGAWPDEPFALPNIPRCDL